MHQLNYLDIFNPEFLDKLYYSFQRHINLKSFKDSFFSKINESILVGKDWDNINSFLISLDANLDKSEISEFLEGHCYSVWFAKRQLDNHNFNFLEKSALVGWEFYCDEETPGKIPENFIKEIRSDVSEGFIDKVFSNIIKESVDHYQDFINDSNSPSNLN